MSRRCGLTEMSRYPPDQHFHNRGELAASIKGFEGAEGMKLTRTPLKRHRVNFTPSWDSSPAALSIISELEEVYREVLDTYKQTQRPHCCSSSHENRLLCLCARGDPLSSDLLSRIRFKTQVFNSSRVRPLPLADCGFI